jgi:hypothetical protein
MVPAFVAAAPPAFMPTAIRSIVVVVAIVTVRRSELDAGPARSSKQPDLRNRRRRYGDGRRGSETIHKLPH